jgi:hypothetical protein
MADDEEVNAGLSDDLEVIDGWVPVLAKRFELLPDSSAQEVIDRVGETADPAALPVLRRALAAVVEYRAFWQANDALRQRRGLGVTVLLATSMEEKLRSAIERCTPQGEPVVYEEPPPQAPSPSALTLILIVLNVAAALGFGYLLLLDYDKRQAWSYAVFRHDLALWGLPLDEDETHTTGRLVVSPPQRLDPDQLKKEFEQRNRGVRVADKFQPVHDVVGQRIKPSQLSDEVLNDVFKGVPGKKVKTLQEEMKDVQPAFFRDVEKAAEELAETAKGDADKRKKLADLLLPLASSTWLIEKVDSKIKSAKAADLGALLVDAGQRRVLVDVLRLLEERRPVAPTDDNEEEQKRVAASKSILDNSADTSAVKLDQIKELLEERFKQATSGGPGKLDSESYEKRHAIAYLLYALSQARKPDGQPLSPDAAKRVEVVVGLYDYNQAADTLALALRNTTQRLVDAIADDREGYALQTNGKEKVLGFVGRHQALIQRIVDTVAEIKEQEAQLGRFRELEAQHKRQYDNPDDDKNPGRKQHYDDVVAKLLKARNETALQVAELRRLEQQLFQAQLDLADAARRNEQLERAIRDAERALRGGKK